MLLKKFLLGLFTILAFILILPGCVSSVQSQTPLISPTINPITSPSVSLLQTTAILNPSAVSVPETEVRYFPVIVPQPSVIYGSISVYEGKLVIIDGYIKAVDFRTGEAAVVLFPQGYSLDTAHSPIQILDDKSQVVAQLGDNLRCRAAAETLKS